MAEKFKSRLFLDFDGVINAANPLRGADTQIVRKRVAVPIGGGLAENYLISFSSRVIETLDRLRNQYAMELVWVSTWNEGGNVFRLPPLLDGLSGGRMLDGSAINRRLTTLPEWTRWKADAIIEDLRNNELPFVWVDDDAVHCHQDTVQEAYPDTEKLMVAPAGRKGLLLPELEAIEQFLINNT